MRSERVQLGHFVTELFGKSEYLFFITYKGLTVAQFTALRQALVEKNAGCTVLKNTYVRFGLAQNGVAVPENSALSGDTAVIHGSGDAAGMAKLVQKLAKDYQHVTVKGGVLDGTYLTAEDAKAVADLPPLNVLRAQMLGVLQGPSRNFVSVLNQKVASIAFVVAAYQKKLENQAQ